MRKLIIALALTLGVVYILLRMAEVQAVVETLGMGDWRFLMLALGVQLAWLYNIAAVLQAIYRSLGLEERVKKLILLAAAANFVNVVAPSAGVGGMAVFIADAQRKGHSSARVTVAGVLFVLVDYLGFFCVLALGLAELFRSKILNSTELIATAILLTIAGWIALMIFLGMRSAHALEMVLVWIARLVNRLIRPFVHREYLSEARAHVFAEEMSSGLGVLREEPARLVPPILLAVGSKLLLVVVLALVFLAFKTPATLGMVIAGFSIGYLFLIVSPTPAGLGVVEGALTLALNSMGIPFGAAAVITLAYRGLTFWVPLLLGFAAFRLLAHPAGARSSI